MVDHASWTRKDLADSGVRHPFTVIDAKPDNILSISSEVARRTLGWQSLLSEVVRRKLPPLVRNVMDNVGREELRAYPMLSQPRR